MRWTERFRWHQRSELVTSSPDAAVAALQCLSPRPQLPLHPLLGVLEAMACGVPLISNVGSPIAADLKHDKDALVVPFNDVKELAQAVVALLQEPERAQQLGDHARETMQRSFNLAASAKAYEELFGRLIGSKKP